MSNEADEPADGGTGGYGKLSGGGQAPSSGSHPLIAHSSLLIAPLLAVFVAALDLSAISTILPGIIYDLDIGFT